MTAKQERHPRWMQLLFFMHIHFARSAVRNDAIVNAFVHNIPRTSLSSTAMPPFLRDRSAAKAM